MKTAVSIPDDLFKAAEREAKRQGVSRSRLVQSALTEYLKRQREEDITARLNASIAKYGDPYDDNAPVLDAAFRAVMSDTEWKD